jgi:S-adenosylhomocysteine hydrolase
MSKTTENLNLTKLELTDVADITLLNENWDKIDSKMVELEETIDEKIGNIDLSEVTNQIEELNTKVDNIPISNITLV